MASNFEKAFAAARRAGKSTFDFGGKSYTTKMKDDSAETRPRARPAAPTTSPRPAARANNSAADTRPQNGAATTSPRPKARGTRNAPTARSAHAEVARPARRAPSTREGDYFDRSMGSAGRKARRSRPAIRG